MNSKQIVTLGVGLVVVIAFGYRSLVSQPQTSSSWESDLTPLNVAPLTNDATPPATDDADRQGDFVGHQRPQPSAQLELDSSMRLPLPTTPPLEEPRRPAAEPSSGSETVQATLETGDETPDGLVLELLPPPETQRVALSGPEETRKPVSLSAPGETNLQTPEVAAAAAPKADVADSAMGVSPLVTVNSAAGPATDSGPFGGWQANPFVDAVALEDHSIAPAEQQTDVQPNPPATQGEPTPAPPRTAPVQPLLEAGQVGPSATADPQTKAIPTQSANSRVLPAGAELMPARVPLEPTAARRAVHHIEYGKALSRRGAGHSARQEFLAALKLVVDANDQQTGDHRHHEALKRAMQIIDESGDFGIGNPEQQIQLNVADVVQGHRSQVLSPADAAPLSAIEAMSHYLAAAQHQLDLASGRNVVAAEIYYCLGKLHSLAPEGSTALAPMEAAKSVLFHQAALASSPQHHRSANELGVLFARSGRLEESKGYFERSLMAQPTPQTWLNLARVHRRLGEKDLAQRAENEYRLASQQQPAAEDASILWKPTEQFNAEAPAGQPLARPATPRTANSPSRDSEPTLTERLKDLF